MSDPALLDVRCRAARVWISSAVDGEATRSELVAMRAHLAECADCRAWAALAESLALQVRTAEPAVTHDLFVPASPETEIETAGRRRRRIPLRALLATSGVAAALVAGIVVASGSNQGSPTTTGSAPVITVASNAAGVVDGEASFLLHATGAVHRPSASDVRVTFPRRPMHLRSLSSAQ
jgi:predicted anti-sigma-YlaC factor YlaD